MIPASFVEFSNLLSESVFLVREDGRIEAANRACVDVTGLRAGDLAGRSLQDLVTDPPARVLRFLQLCAGSGEPLPGSLTFLREGEPLECRCDGVRFGSDPDAPALVLVRSRARHEVGTQFRALNETIDSLWREIAERRRVEQALRGSEELTRRILSSTADCIAVLDLDGRLLAVNQPGRVALELPEGSYEGRSWIELWQPEDRRAAAEALAAARAGRGGRLYGRPTHSGPGRRWWDVLITPVLGVDQRPERLVAVARDVTERRLTEEQLRQSAKMEAIGRLAGGLAHDFNNHLHVQSGLVGFVLRDPGLSPESRRDLIEIQAIADHMASLTRQLLAFSRQQVLRLEALDLNRTVIDTQPLLQRLIGPTIEVRLRLHDRPLWVHADRSQLLQVLMNLSINARDAMSAGGRLEIATGARRVAGHELDQIAGTRVRPGEFVSLTVADTGTGIAPEHLPHIFEPFFTTKEVGEGTGLGLATVHGVVSQSLGYVWAESEVGRGTRFTVLLPQVGAPAELEGDAGTITHGRRTSVLLVEDDDTLRGVLARTLEAADFRVLQSRNGLEALDCLRQAEERPSVIVSDMAMPVLGGSAFAARLAQEYPEIPVVWVSGHPIETDFASGLLGREQRLLQKPIAPELLLEAIRRILESEPVQATPLRVLR